MPGDQISIKSWDPHHLEWLGRFRLLTDRLRTIRAPTSRQCRVMQCPSDLNKISTLILVPVKGQCRFELATYIVRYGRIKSQSLIYHML